MKNLEVSNFTNECKVQSLKLTDKYFSELHYIFKLNPQKTYVSGGHVWGIHGRKVRRRM